MEEIKKDTVRRAIVCGVHRQGEEDACLTSLRELIRLLETAGGVCVSIVTQMRPSPDNATYVGSGKVEELKQLCETNDAELVVVDDELSPSQIKNLEDGVGASVIDRSMLILDIFALHANTAEGRLQVELAQLRYTAPRLIGHGKDMSRLGGGIGTRGPGESKLEIDRRRTRERIALLEEGLRHLDRTRSTMRAARDRSGVARCAIVGYTNAGKSTLLNYLTGAGILAEDKLFATLDPTTRQYELPGGTKVLLTDTVGFIHKLPHHLIRAFKSTLDEAVFADLLMIVCDASDPEFLLQLSVTEQLLTELGADGKPVLYVFNKCDRCTNRETLSAMRAAASGSNAEFVFVSAKTGAGMETLIAKLEGMSRLDKSRCLFHFPVSDGGNVSLLYAKGDDVHVRYAEDGVWADAIVDEKLLGQLSAFYVGPGFLPPEEAEND